VLETDPLVDFHVHRGLAPVFRHAHFHHRARGWYEAHPFLRAELPFDQSRGGACIAQDNAANMEFLGRNERKGRISAHTVPLGPADCPHGPGRDRVSKVWHVDPVQATIPLPEGLAALAEPADTMWASQLVSSGLETMVQEPADTVVEPISVLISCAFGHLLPHR
jgi:hypothetical protein